MSNTISVIDSNPRFFAGSSRLRLAGGIPLAVIITAMLLFAMQRLIHMESPPIDTQGTPKIPSINMNIPTKVSVKESEPPVRPVMVEVPPEINPITPIEVEPNFGNPGIGGPVVTTKLPINVAFTAGQMIPFIKVPPQYPQSALSKGVEGYVDVIFDVTELGTTDNIRILGYEPSSVFNRSVIKAIKNWKYKPNVVDGVPVRTPDVRDRVRFNLEK